jgi:hypothetical protein
MNISDYDKNQIQQINEQVELLQSKHASDEAIIDALEDFIPDVICFIENMETAELKKQMVKYDNFAYFVSLVLLEMKFN